MSPEEAKAKMVHAICKRAMRELAECGYDNVVVMGTGQYNGATEWFVRSTGNSFANTAIAMKFVDEATNGSQEDDE